MTTFNNLSDITNEIIDKLDASRWQAINLCEAVLLAMKNGNHYIEFGEQTLTVDEALQMLKAIRRESRLS